MNHNFLPTNRLLALHFYNQLHQKEVQFLQSGVEIQDDTIFYAYHQLAEARHCRAGTTE